MALKFNPNNTNAITNLGLYYELRGEYELAQQQYEQANNLGNVAACNNLAFTHITQGNYQQAEDMLFYCLPEAKVSNKEMVQYTILKNIGWANFEQGDYSEAEVHLQEAIAIQPYEGPAYCLLAQVLEAQNESITTALHYWDKCVDFARPHLPEEREWKEIGEERLKEHKININKSFL